MRDFTKTMVPVALLLSMGALGCSTNVRSGHNKTSLVAEQADQAAARAEAAALRANQAAERAESAADKAEAIFKKNVQK